MEDQGKFLEILQEIKAIAVSQQNYLTKEEIKKYFGDENFSGKKCRRFIIILVRIILR